MQEKTLRQLVTEAQALAGSHPCVIFGHVWEFQGGRACDYCENGSQSVFQCARCGDWDYGEPGGPGYEECKKECREWREEAR